MNAEEKWQKARDILNNNPSESQIEEARQLLLDATGENCFDAYTTLGLMYEQGVGFEQDCAKAYECYRKAADNGSIYGMYVVGLCYQEGTGVKEDIEIASDWWFRAASKGQVDACHQLGCFYFFTKHDFSNGLKWLNRAVEQDYPLSFGALGDIYLNGWSVDKDTDRGVGYLTRAGELGFDRAMWKLFSIYHDGNMVEKDADKARYWLEKYLEQDSPHAHYVMGVSLYTGDMYAVDMQKALEHAAAAVRGGCHDADRLYITMRWHGNGAEKNQQEVLDMYAGLAANGNAAAMYMLFTLYVDESADVRNVEKALEYFHMAEESDDADVLRDVAKDYIVGEEGVVEQDYDKAIAILGRFPEDDVQACYLLGYAILNLNESPGKYTWERSEQGFRLMQKAAQMGMPEAMMAVAYSYLNGRGVIIDHDIAKNWLESLLQMDYETEQVKALLEKFCKGDRSWDFSLCYQYWYEIVQNNQSRISIEEPLAVENKGISIDVLMRSAALLGEKNAIELLAGLADGQDRDEQPEPPVRVENNRNQSSAMNKLNKIIK